MARTAVSRRSKGNKRSTAAADSPEVPASREVFEGFIRHTCGWINVKGNSFPVGAGCPRCKQRILAVEKLSEAEVKSLGLGKLKGAALDRAIFEQKYPALQELEELEDGEDEDELEDDDGEGDDGDDDDDDDGEE